MRISDWSSDVCSSDLAARRSARPYVERRARPQSHSRTPLSPRVAGVMADKVDFKKTLDSYRARRGELRIIDVPEMQYLQIDGRGDPNTSPAFADAVETLYRSEEHTSELQSIMRISYAVFCLEKNIKEF